MANNERAKCMHRHIKNVGKNLGIQKNKHERWIGRKKLSKRLIQKSLSISFQPKEYIHAGCRAVCSPSFQTHETHMEYSAGNGKTYQHLLPSKGETMTTRAISEEITPRLKCPLNKSREHGQTKKTVNKNKYKQRKTNTEIHFRRAGNSSTGGSAF